MPLETYRQKRNFKTTPEPAGKVQDVQQQRFVVQEHHASQLHYDFRLEMDGVLKSWALPKGPTLDPRQKHLAVQVEDHPVDYLDFEGHIEEGNYGAGEVVIWDSGEYEPLEGNDPSAQLADGKFSFILHGQKLQGEFHLVQMQRRDKQWLFIKGKDEFADPKWQLEPLLEEGQPASNGRKKRTTTTRSTSRVRSAPRAITRAKEAKAGPTLSYVPGAIAEPMPDQLEPMLAKLVDKPFSDPDWLYETKWDGVRALCYIADGQARFVSRNQKDMGQRYPELADIPKWVKAKQVILDGEIVSLDQAGRSSFQQIQARLGLENMAEIKRRVQEFPAVYMIFDLLYYDGFNLMPGALIHRKALLRDLVTWNDRVRYSEHVLRDGEGAFKQAQQQGLEGIVAKRQDSPYVQRRSSEWLKLKTIQQQEVVIGGYTQPRGTRELIGALVAGVYRDGELHYVGHVGGGFNHETLRQVYDQLQSLKVNRSPFAEPPQTNEPVQWVKPDLVCEVKFAEWTSDRRMRQPIFLGLRDDKPAKEVVLEEKQATEAEVQQAEKKPRSRTRSAANGQHSESMKTKPASDKAVSAATFFKRKTLSGDQTVKVDDQVVSLTHLDKVYWPDEGYTKGDLLRYYYQMSKYLLPYLEDRPLILKRYPNGITQNPFFQHDVDNVPDFVETRTLEVEDGHFNDYILGNNRATLLYLAQLGTIAQNPWLSRAADLDHPDWIVLDLDPGKTDFSVVCEVALAINQVCDELKVKAYAKTSGSDGLHVYIPIKPQYTYEEAARFAERVAGRVAKQQPQIATVQRSIKSRPSGTVYVDYLQNARGKSVVAPYVVRARPGAPVSAPLTWAEVKRQPRPIDFTIMNMPDRVAKKGDLFKPVLTTRQTIDYAIEHLK